MNLNEKLNLMEACLMLAAVAGCGDANNTAAHEEDPAEHACDIVADSGTALTASADAASAPPISPSEEPYTVTLTPGQAGYLKIMYAAPLEAILFAKTANVVDSLVIAGTGDNLLVEASPNEFCGDQIPEHWELDRDMQEDLVLQLGPAAVTEVWLALTSATGHGHE